MTNDELRTVHARAKAVCDGFKRVRDQNARDCVKVAEHALALARDNAALREEVEARQRGWETMRNALERQGKSVEDVLGSFPWFK